MRQYNYALAYFQFKTAPQHQQHLIRGAVYAMALIHDSVRQRKIEKQTNKQT